MTITALATVSASVNLITKVGTAYATWLKDNPDINPFIENGLLQYCERTHLAFQKTKTILTGTQVLDFHEYYFKLSVKKEQSAPTVVDTSRDFFQDDKVVVVLGGAGSGKSTLLRFLFHQVIKEAEKIPLYVELRRIRDASKPSSLKDFIKKSVIDYTGVTDKQFDNCLDVGMFIIFFDGFDEIDFRVRHEIAAQINELITLYQECKFILSSRPGTNLEYSQMATIREMCPVHPKNLETFTKIVAQGCDKELLLRICESYTNKENLKIVKEFLGNPLLISLYILTFQADTTIPQSRSRFYQRVIGALFSEHDSKTKLGFIRERRVSLSRDDFEKILQAYSFIAQKNSSYSFNRALVASTLFEVKKIDSALSVDVDAFIDDLALATCLWKQEGDQYLFTHRSLQEFFASEHIRSFSRQTKELFWKSLLDKIFSGEFFDIFGIIDILRETDEINTAELFEIPLIEKILKQINRTTEKHITLSLIALLCDTFIIAKNNAKGASFTCSWSSNWMTGIEISFRHQAHVLLTHFFSCDILAPLSKNSSNYNYKIQTSDLSRKMTEKEFWECYNVFVMDNIFKEEAIKLSIPIDLISLVNAQVSKLDQRLSALKEKMENFEKIGKGYIALLLK